MRMPPSWSPHGGTEQGGGPPPRDGSATAVPPEAVDPEEFKYVADLARVISDSHGLIYPSIAEELHKIDKALSALIYRDHPHHDMVLVGEHHIRFNVDGATVYALTLTDEQRRRVEAMAKDESL